VCGFALRFCSRSEDENSGDSSMNTLVNAGGAIALACALLLCAAAPALAHDGHKKKAQEAGSEHEEERPPATVEPNAHDHASHGATKAPTEESNAPKPLAWLGKFHPPLTHFPIALLTAAALGELLFIRTGTASYRHAVVFCVRLGALAALLAAPLGWFFAGFRIVDEDWVMTAHRWAGTTVAVFAVALLLLLEKRELADAHQSRFRIALFSAAGLVGATGFLGGALLYGLDHYSW